MKRRLAGKIGILVTLIAFWGGCDILRAQMSYESQEDTYTQDFGTLPYSGSSFTWTDNSTIPGWYAASSATAGFNLAGITIGSTTTGDLYSFGSSGSKERAQGSIGSGTVGSFFWGVKFINNTGTTITGFTISYTGEQWRRATTEQKVTELLRQISFKDEKKPVEPALLDLHARVVQFSYFVGRAIEERHKISAAYPKP